MNEALINFLQPNRAEKVGEGGVGEVCITASGNILASGNISLELFMAPLEK